MATDRFQAPDYYLLDELLSDEQKLVRDTARAFVKKEISPIIEDACQKAEFPKHLIKGLGNKNISIDLNEYGIHSFAFFILEYYPEEVTKKKFAEG